MRLRRIAAQALVFLGGHAVAVRGFLVPMATGVADAGGGLLDVVEGLPVVDLDSDGSRSTRPTGHRVQGFGRHAAEFLFQGCHPRFQPGVARQETPCQFDGLEPRAELHAGERTTAALDRLEQAERAADKARQRVLKRPVKELGGTA